MNSNQLREHPVEGVTVTTKFLELCSKSVLINEKQLRRRNDKYSTQ